MRSCSSLTGHYSSRFSINRYTDSSSKLLLSVRGAGELRHDGRVHLQDAASPAADHSLEARLEQAAVVPHRTGHLERVKQRRRTAPPTSISFATSTACQFPFCLQPQCPLSHRFPSQFLFPETMSSAVPNLITSISVVFVPERCKKRAVLFRLLCRNDNDVPKFQRSHCLTL